MIDRSITMITRQTGAANCAEDAGQKHGGPPGAGRAHSHDALIRACRLLVQAYANGAGQ